MTRSLSGFALVLILITSSCIAQKRFENFGELKGVIGIFEGNCMPGPGVPPCEPKPISTTVYITQLNQDFQWELLVDSVSSNDVGVYSIKLPEGSYSLFLRDENSFVCDVIECPDECYCHPFEIVADSTTVINANLDHATW
ncbi:hypothetical protein [Ekhidna sp.]|uniref:hypothetical protein n=1 Tax=Ekhidna sp. TaxID=2608089 RepID=UPI003C7C4028